MRRLYCTDSILFFELVGFTSAAQPLFAEPIVIKGRWDTVQQESQLNDKIEVHSNTVTVYPDRVLSIGSVLMLGDEETIKNLSPQELKNPLLLSAAVTIKSQSTIAEFGRPQKATYPVGYKSKHLTIECRC